MTPYHLRTALWIANPKLVDVVSIENVEPAIRSLDILAEAVLDHRDANLAIGLAYFYFGENGLDIYNIYKKIVLNNT